jgi:hypothetical protein
LACGLIKRLHLETPLQLDVFFSRRAAYFEDVWPWPKVSADGGIFAADIATASQTTHLRESRRNLTMLRNAFGGTSRRFIFEF